MASVTRRLHAMLGDAVVFSMIRLEDDITCRLTLTEPVTGYGRLGRKRSIKQIHLALDDAEAFLQAVNRKEHDRY